MEIQTDNPKEGYPFPCFSFDEKKTIALNTAYVMSSNTVDVCYILGVLNSVVGRMIARLYVTQLQERQFRMLAQYLANFPIPKVSIEIQKLISLSVKKLLCNNQTIEESQIDDIVCRIYRFTKSEINYMKSLA